MEDLLNVREIRRCGFIAGIEVAQKGGDQFDWRDQVGSQICLAARRHGLLTRPIRDVIVLMLPLCVTAHEIDLAVDAIGNGIVDICGSVRNHSPKDRGQRLASIPASLGSYGF